MTKNNSADKSGRSGIIKNVLTSWGSQLVFIAFGFVLPRVIDSSLGQELLGIWDFGWAIVSYLGIAMVGTGASVNRYVARYRASGENEKLSSSVSSISALQVAIGSTVLAVVIALYFWIPDLLGDRLGTHVKTAANLVLLLGSALSVQMMCDAFRGITTGCHEWGIYNTVNAGGYAIAGIGMLISLHFDGGLEAMAAVYLAATILTEIVRIVIAHRICPEFQFRAALVNRKDMLKMFRFGMKNVLIFLPSIIIRQTISLFVMANLGAVTLAVLSRPLALVGHLTTLMNKFAYVLTPVAGSLQSSGDEVELRNFTLSTMRAGWILAVVPTTFMLVFGDKLIELWMGVDYVDLPLIIILFGGAIFPMSQQALSTTLVGMNEHGQVAKTSLIMTLSVVFVGYFIVSSYGWTLHSAALLMVVALNLGVAGVILAIGSRILKFGYAEYVQRVLRDPMLLLVISLAVLLVVRRFAPESALQSFLYGGVSHALVIGIFLRKELKAVLFGNRPSNSI